MTRRVEHGAQLYARQKLFEALYSLVGNASFRDRLILAAGSLTQLLPADVARLPDSVRDRYIAVVDALTKYPPSPPPRTPLRIVEHVEHQVASGELFPRYFDSGIAASVHKLTPLQRRKIAEEILSLFVALSGGL